MVGCLSCLMDSDWPIYAVYLVFASCCFLLNLRVMKALKAEARSSHKDEALAEGIV